jgi:hypothetical protein
MVIRQFLAGVILVTSVASAVGEPEPTAQRDFVTATQLREMCRSDLLGQCMGFVVGVNDTAAAIVQNLPRGTEPMYCLPRGVTIRQITVITKKYLDEHPTLSYAGAGLVLTALRDAFPCRP